MATKKQVLESADKFTEAFTNDLKKFLEKWIEKGMPFPLIAFILMEFTTAFTFDGVGVERGAELIINHLNDLKNYASKKE